MSFSYFSQNFFAFLFSFFLNISYLYFGHHSGWYRYDRACSVYRMWLCSRSYFVQSNDYPQLNPYARASGRCSSTRFSGCTCPYLNCFLKIQFVLKGDSSHDLKVGDFSLRIGQGIHPSWFCATFQLYHWLWAF